MIVIVLVAILTGFTALAVGFVWTVCEIARALKALWPPPKPRAVPVASGGLRATDRSRERASAALAERYVEGRLTVEELEQRSGQALRASTAGELAALFADLPETSAGFARPRLASLEALAGLALVLLAPGPARLMGATLLLVAVRWSERARMVTIPLLVAAALLG